MLKQLKLVDSVKGGAIKTGPLATVSEKVPNSSQGMVVTRLKCGEIYATGLQIYAYCRD